MSTRQQRRAMLEASFELHGWQPYSSMGKRGHPTREAVLCNAQGYMLRRVPSTGLVIHSTKRQTLRNFPNRMSRTFADITLPALEGMWQKLQEVETAQAAKAKIEAAPQVTP